MRHRIHKHILPGLVAASLILASASGSASMTTTTMQVTATVLASCSVSAFPMAFGNYDPTSATNINGTTNVSVTCTSGTSYTIGLGAGNAPGATVTNRAMTGVTNTAVTLKYGLYQDSGHQINWGNTPGVDTPAAQVGTGASAMTTVFGTIMTLQTSATPQNYTDTVIVTVNY